MKRHPLNHSVLFLQTARQADEAIQTYKICGVEQPRDCSGTVHASRITIVLCLWQPLARSHDFRQSTGWRARHLSAGAVLEY